MRQVSLLLSRLLAILSAVVFLMSTEAYSFVSSRLVKEVASLGGSVAGLVPSVVEERLVARFGRKSTKE